MPGFSKLQSHKIPTTPEHSYIVTVFCVLAFNCERVLYMSNSCLVSCDNAGFKHVAEL